VCADLLVSGTDFTDSARPGAIARLGQAAAARYPALVTQPAPIPSGTVTLLFTDVQGSTRLWEAEPELMAVALRRHDEILRSVIEAAGGYVFKTVGDAFCAAFWTAQAAVGATLAAQRELGEQSWPTSRPILVRMGVHTGVCEERDSDYFGPVVNRAARLEAAAHGGQVLVSGATAELLAGSLPAGTGLRDMGLHRLKDLGRPEQVFQLEASFLAPDFPPLSSLDNPELPNNLPTLLSAFVGREKELAEVRELIRTSRLVTLTGAGGSGKTRLALQAGAELIGRTADGVWLAELAPLTDGGQIAGVVAGALGIQDLGGLAVADTVIEALSEQESLILLDNCEHLIDAAAKFCDEVIRHCPKVRFLVTSREPLGIDGERVYRVPSLTLPGSDAESVDDLAGSDAVQLFVERARAHQPDFVIDGLSAADAVTICRRLDGIPLALELAAARLSSMSLAQVAARLDQRFRLLTGGSRNAMPRQQTLQATVDWSFGLLSGQERETLTRLSVFAGGFDLDAAEVICASAEVDALDVLDLLGSLVDKSLVVADHTPRAVRYRLLETMRQYSAQELLRACGDAEVLRIRDRHARYYLELAKVGGPATTGPAQGQWLRRFDTEWDNLRAAFAHLAAEGCADEIMTLGVSLKRFCLSRGHPEVLDYLRPLIDKTDVQPTALLADAMAITGQLLGMLSRTDAAELAAAREYGEKALAMARAVGDKRVETHAITKLVESAYVAGDMAAGHRLAEQGVAIARELDDVQLLGEQLQGLASTAPTNEERASIQREVLACSRQAGDDLLVASLLNSKFSLELNAGLIEEGSASLEEAVALIEGVGGDLVVHFLQCNLALLRLIQERYAEAAPIVRSCLRTSRRLGPGVGSGELIFAAACIAAWQGDDLRAARLQGAGDADIDASLELRTINWSNVEQELRVREQAKLRARLGDAAYDAAYRSGAGLTPSQALNLALGRDAYA
jgi:predicted ATPase/class 3 adenylate cyclase